MPEALLARRKNITWGGAAEMNKIDLHMHIMTTHNLPKLGRLNLSGPKAIMRDPEFGLRFLETYADRLFFVRIKH